MKTSARRRLPTTLQILTRSSARRATRSRQEAGPNGAVIALRGHRFANPAGLVDLIQRNASTLKLRPDQKIVCLRNWENEKIRLTSVARLLQALVEIANAAKPEMDAALPPPIPALVKPQVARRA